MEHLLNLLITKFMDGPILPKFTPPKLVVCLHSSYILVLMYINMSSWENLLIF